VDGEQGGLEFDRLQLQEKRRLQQFLTAMQGAKLEEQIPLGEGWISVSGVQCAKNSNRQNFACPSQVLPANSSFLALRQTE
jgi:hypothetical protein